MNIYLRLICIFTFLFLFPRHNNGQIFNILKRLGENNIIVLKNKIHTCIFILTIPVCVATPLKGEKYLCLLTCFWTRNIYRPIRL